MKFIFSILMIPAFIVSGLIFLGGGMIYLDAGGYRPVEDCFSFWSNAYFCLLHFSMAVALALSVLNLLYCAGLTIFGLIARSRIRTLIAAGLAVFSFFATNYLLNTNI